MREKKKKLNLQKVACSNKTLKPHSRSFLSWVFFCVNENNDMSVANKLIMCYILCFNNAINASNPKT